jgi:signal transduction histidine kinase
MPGGGTITISGGNVRERWDDGVMRELVRLSVADTGIGMSPEVRTRAFDPFFTTKDVGHGTGLGLYLTHQIAEQHGGTIRLESAPGEGTAVHVTLPLGAVRPVDSGEQGGTEEPRRAS